MAWLALAVATALPLLLSAQTRPEDYPNPATSPRECGLRGKGFVCDPDGVLSDNDRNEMSTNLLKKVYQGTQNKHRGSECMKKGITVVVALVNKIPSRGAKATPQEMESWTRNVQRRWKLEPKCKKDVVIGFSKQDRQMKVINIPEFTGITTREVNKYFNAAKGKLKAGQYRQALEGMSMAFADEYTNARNLRDPLGRTPGGGFGGGGGGGGRGRGQMPKLPEFKMPKFGFGLIGFFAILLLICCCCCCLCYCCRQLRQSFCPCFNKSDGGARGGMGRMGNFSLPEGFASKIPASLFGGRMGRNRMDRYGGGMGMGGMGLGGLGGMGAGAAMGAGAGYMAGGSGGEFGGGGGGGFSDMGGGGGGAPPDYEAGGGGWGDDTGGGGGGGGAMYPEVKTSGGAFDTASPSGGGGGGGGAGGGGW